MDNNSFDPDAYLQAKASPEASPQSGSFDPDSYLAAKAQPKAQSGTFNPDAYLQQKTQDAPKPDPVAMYADAQARLKNVDVDPDHFGGLDSAADNPQWQANSAAAQKLLDQQQAAVDLFRQQNAKAPSTLGSKAEFAAETVGDLFPHPSSGSLSGALSPSNWNAGGILHGVADVAKIPYTAVDQAVQTGVQAAYPKGSPQYNQAALRQSADATAVQEALPDFGNSVINAGTAAHNAIFGTPTTDEAIRNQLNAKAMQLNADKEIEANQQAALAQKTGANADQQISAAPGSLPTPKSQLTPEAQQTFQGTKADVANAVNPANVAFIGGGEVASALGREVVGPIAKDFADSVADHPVVAPVVAAAKQAASTAAQVPGALVQGLGKTIQYTGKAVGSPIGSGLIDVGAGAVLGHDLGFGHMAGALGGLIGGAGDKLTPALGQKLEGAGAALADTGSAMRQSAAGTPMIGPAQPPTIFGKAASGAAALFDNPVTKNALSGAVFALPFAAQADTPQEAADQLGNGAAFGLLGAAGNKNFNSGLRQMGMKYYADIAPETYGAPVDVNGQSFDLDAAHAQAVSALNPQQQTAVQAMRGFLPGAQIYVLPSDVMAQVGKAANIPDVAGLYDAPQITTDLKINGQPQKVILLNGDLASLNHEAGHFIFDSLNPDQKQTVLGQLAQVPDSKLQSAYIKYTLSLARAHNYGEKLPANALTLDDQGNPVLSPSLKPEEASAVTQALTYWENNPTALAKEYIAEQFNDLANGKGSSPESLAAQTGNKSFAQSIADGYSTVRQALGGSGRTTPLGFQVDPALQNSLRGVLSTIGEQRTAEGKITPPTPPAAPLAAPLNVPPSTASVLVNGKPTPITPTAPPLATPPAPAAPTVNDQGYKDASDAARKLGLNEARIKVGLQSAQAGGLTDSGDILTRILNPSSPKATAPAPKVEVTPPEPVPADKPLSQAAPSVANAIGDLGASPVPLATPPQQEQPEPNNNIRVESGVGPKASIDPFARTGVPSNVPPLSASEGLPIVGFKPQSSRFVTKEGDVDTRDTGALVGRAINPRNENEVAMAGKAAVDSGNPDQFKENLNDVQQAIADGKEVNFTYQGAASEVAGSPTDQERGESQAAADLGMERRMSVQKTMTPTNLTIQETAEPDFSDKAAVDQAKAKAVADFNNPRKRTLKSAFTDVNQVHAAIDEIARARGPNAGDNDIVQGLSRNQVAAATSLFPTEPKTRFYANGYSQDKVIANAKNLASALEDSNVLNDPQLAAVHSYLTSGQFAKDLKARNENMAHGYRGDGNIFTNAKGEDVSKDRRESEGAPAPTIIPDDKTQVLNLIEGGASRTYTPEANANAATSGRPTVDLKTSKASSNPLEAKLNALGENLYLARGANKIAGLHEIISPATEKLRLDRVVDAKGQAPVELPPSAYAQRAAGYMPHADIGEGEWTKENEKWEPGEPHQTSESHQIKIGNIIGRIYKKEPYGPYSWPTGRSEGSQGGYQANIRDLSTRNSYSEGVYPENRTMRNPDSELFKSLDEAKRAVEKEIGNINGSSDPSRNAALQAIREWHDIGDNGWGGPEKSFKETRLEVNDEVEKAIANKDPVFQKSIDAAVKANAGKPIYRGAFVPVPKVGSTISSYFSSWSDSPETAKDFSKDNISGDFEGTGYSPKKGATRVVFKLDHPDKYIVSHFNHEGLLPDEYKGKIHGSNNSGENELNLRGGSFKVKSAQNTGDLHLVELEPKTVGRMSNQRAQFMPKTDTEEQTNEPTTSQTPLSRTATYSQLRPAGDTSGTDIKQSPLGRPLLSSDEAPNRPASLRPLSSSGNQGSAEPDPYTESKPSTPEQWIQQHLTNLGNDKQWRFSGNGPEEEKAALQRSAEKGGTLIPGKLIERLEPYKVTGGVEHDVYLPPKNEDGTQSIYKVTRSDESAMPFGNYEDEIQYTRNLGDLDALAGGKLGTQILGVTDENEPRIVTKQNYIAGRHPYSLSDVRDAMGKYGFEEIPQSFMEFKHPDSNVILGDVHQKNIILTPDGGAVLIDGDVRGDVHKPMFMPKTDQHGFYSQAEKNAEEGPNKATVSQWRALLGPEKGVKADEAKWANLQGLFQGKNDNDSLTKQQVLDHLQANRTQVNETTLGKNNVDQANEDLKAANKAFDREALKAGFQHHQLLHLRQDLMEDSDAFNKYQENPSLRSAAKAVTDSAYKVNSLLNSGQRLGSDSPKFEGYQLPGGENYREQVLSLPVGRDVIDKDNLMQEIKDRKEALENHIDEGNQKDWGEDEEAMNADSDYIDSERRAIREMEDEHTKAYNAEQKNNYASGHFPDQPNYLAHTRINDRTLSDGRKVLFAEEFQSDRAQSGRKEGYTGTGAPTEEEVGKLQDAFTQAQDKMTSDQDPKNAAANKAAYDKANEALNKAEANRSGSRGVPDMPFAKNWHEFLLKKLLIQAAKEGKDGIAWTTGVQQVDRYPNEMRKVADHISWKPWDESLDPEANSKTLTVKKDGKNILTAVVGKEGKVTEAPSQFHQAIGKSVDELIGKDMAKRVIDERNGAIDGKDFTVGGEGMKGFYDHILPKAANELARKNKWGVKVEAGNIASPIARNPMGDPLLSENPNRPESVPTHVLPITPKMREQLVNEGLPMFQPKDDRPLAKPIKTPSNKVLPLAVASQFQQQDTKPLAHAYEN